MPEDHLKPAVPQAARPRARDEARWRELLAGIPDLVFLLDSQGRFLDFHAGETAQLYAPPEEFLGRRVAEVIPGPLGDQFQRAVEGAAAGQSIPSLAYELAIQGELRQYQARVVLTPGGQVHVLSRDVTEMFRAQAALRESEARLREAQAISHVGHFSWNCGTDRVTWSDELYHMFGYAPGQVAVDFSLYLSHIMGEDRAPVRRAVEETLAHGGSFEHEYRIQRTDGELRWLLVRGRRWEQSGQTLGLEGTCQDITDRKRTEEQLARQQAELLHVSRLSVMGEMVASLAHELAQPLSAISNFASACAALLDAAEQKGPPPLRKHIHEIVGQAERAAEILRQLRSFTRKSSQSRTRRPLEAIVREAGDLVRADLRMRGISLTTEFCAAAAVAEIVADRVQFQQVLVNLLKNACEAAAELPDPERRRVALKVRVADGWAEIDVADFGKGLPPQHPGRLFEPFFTTKPDGMGMGLAICRRIVEDHDGQIVAVPNEPHGARFRVRLPLPRA